MVILKNIYFAFVHQHILYGIEIYGNNSNVHLKKLITLLRILQNKPNKFPVKDNSIVNFGTLAIPELHTRQLLILVHNFLHHPHLLPILLFQII